jgi:hypothetical protein
MRNLWVSEINRWRIRTDVGVGDETCGAFVLPSPIDGQGLRVIASSGGGWDHVSVSRTKRCPNWPEMDFVKRVFFGDEVVMQLHVPSKDHVNYHAFCLHLWRPQSAEIPRPPAWMVGPVAGQIADEALAEGVRDLSVRTR